MTRWLPHVKSGAAGRSRLRPIHRALGFLSVLAVSMTAMVGFAPVAAAEDYVPISGAGSTWSFNAIDQWRKNVLQYGMRVSFAGTGSSDGRNQFKYRQVDFAVSEIPYGLIDGGQRDDPPPHGYAYMPIVAGGTALMYNLKIGGKRVMNLRLSGDSAAKIFTGKITSWADPAIKAENPNLTLPDKKVIPVVRGDGSGSSAQFTGWMASQHQGLWDDYCRRASRSTPCGFTSNYPVAAGTTIVPQQGSIGVSNYVRQDQAEGAITYVEYSYAKAAGFPVARLQNAKGFYIGPTERAVAVALLKANIKDDLTQELGQVYTDQDPRTYPLSSYSYLILPTATTDKFNVDKGKTLSAFASYFLCEGQQQAGRLGFSPLPINLVKAGFEQVKRIPVPAGTPPKNTDLAACNNPTFSTDGTNTLAKNAPQPPGCAAKGSATQCTEQQYKDAEEGKAVTEAVKPGAKAPKAGGGPGAGTVAPGAAPGEQAAVDGAAAEEAVDGGQARASGDGASAVPVSVDLAEDDTTLLIIVSVVLLLALVVGPPLIARVLRKWGGQA